MKPTLGVRKEGNACTVFMNPATDRPVSSHSYEDEPAGAFPRLTKVAEVVALYGQAYNLVFHEKPQRELPSVEKSAAVMQMAAEIAGSKARPQPAAPTYPQPTLSGLIERGMEDLERMLEERAAAQDDATKQQMTLEINAVANFIARLEPSLIDRIKSLPSKIEQKQKVAKIAL